MPGLDETENEFRYRVREPELYDDYGRKDVAPGVALQMGHNKQSGQWEVQSIHFDKDKFSAEQAQAWVDGHQDVATKSMKHAPWAKHYKWKMTVPIEKAEGSLDSEHFYIFGNASVEIIDREGDKITASALSFGLPQLLRRGRLTLDHTDLIVGDILPEVTVKGTTYRTDVLDNSLMVVGDVWKDSKRARETRRLILSGDYDSYSISGESLEQDTVCDRDGCFNRIDKLDLSAVTICQEGMNQAAKFTLLKADDCFVEPSVETLGDKRMGEDKKAEEPKKVENAPPAQREEVKQEAPKDPAPSEKQEAPEEEKPEAPAPPPSEEEESIQAALKGITDRLTSMGEALATLSARVDSIEHGKAAEAEVPADNGAGAEKEAAQAPAKAETPTEGMNASPAPMPAKKSLAADAGGSQFGQRDKRPAWEKIGAQVSKAGGFNKPGSPMLDQRKKR